MSQWGEDMINSSTKTQPGLKRLRWLRSASVLAAASAMVAGGTPAFAQAGPGIGSHNPASSQTFRTYNAADLRAPSQSPVRITNVRALPANTVDTRALPVPANAPNIRHNAVAPNVRSRMAVDPASTTAPPPPTTLVTTTPPPANTPTRTTASVPSSSTPQNAASANGGIGQRDCFI